MNLHRVSFRVTEFSNVLKQSWLISGTFIYDSVSPITSTAGSTT